MDGFENLVSEHHACAFNADCPTRLILNRIADKWTVLVMILLEGETKRFSNLQREIGGISQKMLTQTLRGLERDGLVSRKVYATVPPKVEYALTPLGHTLKVLLYAVKTWSETNIQEVLAAQQDYDQLNLK
ncbi:MAG: helix-turn-helix domain-containing protein [Methylotenera sp.]|uniref:winged helix-turn-helix transcriptional regulator n=1 Tax=Methylotenera sp. TaxID=2051956 RepID=UPI002489A395|nr:helix-turn-helix domain-containing protein [Methylotenera sp.]MDI1308110.1 helix-turn-helix domain-containing protein [Methylotenera sp.]